MGIGVVGHKVVGSYGGGGGTLGEQTNGDEGGSEVLGEHKRGIGEQEMCHREFIKSGKERKGLRLRANYSWVQE